MRPQSKERISRPQSREMVSRIFDEDEMHSSPKRSAPSSEKKYLVPLALTIESSSKGFVIPFQRWVESYETQCALEDNVRMKLMER